MSPDGRQLRAYLGSGGPKPGFLTLNLSQAWTVSPPWLSSRGGSVYAIAPSQDGNKVAIGTRKGTVVVLAVSDDSASEAPQELARFDRSVPILSLRWVSNTDLGVSDIRGQCVIWNTARPDPPTVLETGSSCACSLCLVEEGILAGLSAKGQSLLWDLQGKELVMLRKCPAPPAKNACVELVRWDAAKRLVYPVAGGGLALADWRDGQVATFKAHEGDFYAVAVLGEDLLTAGLSEACAKLWRPGDQDPIREIRLPEGLLSLAVLDIGRKMILGVNSKGRACVYSLEGNEVKILSQVEGEDFRTAVGPHPDDLRQIERERIAAESQALIQEMGEQIDRRQFEGFEVKAERLTELGHARTAWRLILRKAVSEQNLGQELKARIEIFRTDSSAPDSLENLSFLVPLLERFFLYEEAFPIYERLRSIVPDHPMLSRIEEVTALAHLAKNGKPVLRFNGDISCEDGIRAATFLDRRCTGRFQIGVHGPIRCPEVKLSTTEVAQKYEQVRAERGDPTIPPSVLESVCWLSHEGARETEAITFQNTEKGDLGGLELAVQVENAGAETLVTAFLLLNADRVSHEESVSNHNERLAEALKFLDGNRPLMDAWYSNIARILFHALRRLSSAKRAGAAQ